MKKTILTTLLALILAVCMQAQTIEHVYHYQQPIVTEHDGYQQIGFDGCLPAGQVGEPSLPWQSVSLILPQGMEATEIHVEFSDYKELNRRLTLYPYQQPRPVSSEKEIPFAKKETVYHSNRAYPARNYSAVSTQYLNGVGLAFSGFTPVEYVPATGTVRYAQTVKVRIETTSSRSDHSRKLWLTPENEASLRRLAQNEDQLDSYRSRSRVVSGYDMLVITSENWIPRFDNYLSLYNSKGIRTQIVSLEQIYTTMDGCDAQEQIRNYIIQEYENNGIRTVTLGGDVGIVPFRPLWCFAQEDAEEGNIEDQIPADMYYACLDGTLNNDNDDRWGEVGEDDLLPEISIGRLPFNNTSQFNHIMGKTFSYLQNPVLGEFTSPIFGAEHLGNGYFGSTDLNRLVGTCTAYDYTTHGYPADYTFKKYYETPTKPFSGGDFKEFIGTGGQYVHHVGHANTDYVAGWDGAFLSENSFAANDGVNHNYMLFHSHGCVCGDFSHTCILERMVTFSNGFVVTTGNSRYGWYVPWGDGMAAHLHREFLDAYIDSHVPTVGAALREAKIDTAPWVTVYGENGCMRWNIYCLNVIGDPELYPWFEEPFTPNVRYEHGLTAGTTSTTVHVSHFDTPLESFQVSLFDGETLLGRAVTNSNGDAVLNFNPALTANGSMQLIVTGQSAWPQTLEVAGINSDEAYVYGDILGFSAPANYGTSVNITGDLYNKGNVTAHNVQAAITLNGDYVTLQPNDINIADFEANSTLHYDNLGTISIADDVPDQTVFEMQLAATMGEVTHTTQRSFVALAPNLEITSLIADDSEGNNDGMVDPGEHIVLTISGINKGHALAPNATLTFSCDDPDVIIEGTSLSIGDLNSNSTFNTEMLFHTDADITEGSTIVINILLQSGNYSASSQFVSSVGMIAETFESGDFNYIKWEHGGDLPWTITSDNAHSGSFCARSGAITHSQTSSLSVNADILFDGDITFWVMTDCELANDYLAFLIDGKLKRKWSSADEWTFESFNLKAGNHTFEWRYVKSKKNSVGQDCVWIDDISFPRSCVITDVEEEEATQKEVNLYPNPCKGSFTLELAEESDIVISNMLGQTVANFNKIAGIQQIQLEKTGLYIVQIRNASGVNNLKVIVE